MLSQLPAESTAGLFIGLDAPDDAAVCLLDGGDRALVATLDFFPPLVDDPADFGAVAAANALSDVYAMGARPILALNVLAVPRGVLAEDVVAGILAGAAEVCSEAGVPVGGGHSIDDPVPKFGLVALGLAKEEELYRKGGARPGDRLVLGKAVGTGVITTALKRGEAEPDDVAGAVASMRRLNRDALAALRSHAARALTDVSGFGLLGHLREMCRASDLGARVRAGAVPLLSGAPELVRADCVPGGTRRNRRSLDPVVAWGDGVPEELRVLLC
ncbi:MAG: selenide, water dikinase SelD, partial [Gemmatimonadota bacterium]